MARVSISLPERLVQHGGILGGVGTAKDALEKAIAIEPSLVARLCRNCGRLFAAVFVGGRNMNALDRMDKQPNDCDVNAADSRLAAARTP
jgi:hypothetical protein